MDVNVVNAAGNSIVVVVTRTKKGLSDNLSDSLKSK